MLIYIVQGRGLFGSSASEALPAHVQIVGDAGCGVTLDGQAVPISQGGFSLPASLRDGAHELKINGRACEGVVVKKGEVRAQGEDFRRLLPAVARLYELEERVRALEEKAGEKEIYWLK